MQAKTHSRPVWADFRQKLQCIWNPVWVSGEQALGLGRGFPLRCSTRVTPTSSSVRETLLVLWMQVFSVGVLYPDFSLLLEPLEKDRGSRTEESSVIIWGSSGPSHRSLNLGGCQAGEEAPGPRLPHLLPSLPIPKSSSGPHTRSPRLTFPSSASMQGSQSIKTQSGGPSICQPRGIGPQGEDRLAEGLGSMRTSARVGTVEWTSPVPCISIRGEQGLATCLIVSALSSPVSPPPP